MNLYTLIKKYYAGISLVLFLLLIENVAWIVEPTFFGNLIDAFIAKADKTDLSAQIAHVVPLLIWIGIYLLNSGTGTLRRLVEPKIFQKMYVDIVNFVAKRSEELSLPPNTAAARVQMSEEYVTFLQYRIPEIFEQVISITGTVIALYFFDKRITLTCLCISVPMVFLANFYTKKMLPLQAELHTVFENMYHVFAARNKEKTQRTFASIARINKDMAKWDAVNFGVIRIMLLIVFVLVLYIAIDLDDLTTGNIYSIVAYLWTFVSSIEYIPSLLESNSSLTDLSRRINSANED